MASLWQACPIHRTTEVHATSRYGAATVHFFCSLSAIAHSKPCDHGRTSCRARATRRYAGNVDFECFLGSSGTRPLHAVPLQCHPKQCADKHLRPPTAQSDTVAFILPSIPDLGRRSHSCRGNVRCGGLRKKERTWQNDPIRTYRNRKST